MMNICIFANMIVYTRMLCADGVNISMCSSMLLANNVCTCVLHIYCMCIWTLFVCPTLPKVHITMVLKERHLINPP